MLGSIFTNVYFHGFHFWVYFSYALPRSGSLSLPVELAIGPSDYGQSGPRPWLRWEWYDADSLFTRHGFWTFYPFFISLHSVYSAALSRPLLLLFLNVILTRLGLRIGKIRRVYFGSTGCKGGSCEGFFCGEWGWGG
jgi:hypothetical protein